MSKQLLVAFALSVMVGCGTTMNSPISVHGLVQAFDPPYGLINELKVGDDNIGTLHVFASMSALGTNGVLVTSDMCQSGESTVLLAGVESAVVIATKVGHPKSKITLELANVDQNLNGLAAGNSARLTLRNLDGSPYRNWERGAEYILDLVISGFRSNGAPTIHTHAGVQITLPGPR